MNEDALNQYWKTNIKYVSILLTTWFIVSYGAGIFFVDALDSFRFFGFKLGFWFAQQGSEIIFVILILIKILRLIIIL